MHRKKEDKEEDKRKTKGIQKEDKRNKKAINFSKPNIMLYYV